jgi:hypothetical protein
LNIAIFSEVPLWTAHHAEAIEIAMQNNNNKNNVHFISCKGALLGCPANPKKNPLLCMICRSQTNHTSKKILQDKNYITADILLDKRISIDCSFNSIEELQNFSYKDSPIGNMVYSTVVTELNDSFFDIHSEKLRVNELILNAVRVYEFTYNYLINNNIQRLYIWNGRRSCDGPSIYAAKNLGIDFSPFISGGGYNKILIRENVNTVHDVPSAIKELNQIKKDLKDINLRDELIKRGDSFFNIANGQDKNSEDKKEVNYLGYYQFSSNYVTDESFYTKYQDKKIIAAFTGTYSEFAGVPGYDTSEDFCSTFYHGIEFLQEPGVIPDDSILVVRWHPNSRNIQGSERKRLNAIINDAPKNIIHIPPESNFSSYSLIDNSVKVIGFGSSISVESCLRGKPVMFVGRNMFQDLNCFDIPQSFDDIKVFINTDRNKIGSYDDALAWGVYFSSFGNSSFKFLDQKEPKEFFLNNKSIRSPLLRILRKIKNSLKLKTIINLHKNST